MARRTKLRRLDFISIPAQLLSFVVSSKSLFSFCFVWPRMRSRQSSWTRRRASLNPGLKSTRWMISPLGDHLFFNSISTQGKSFLLWVMNLAQVYIYNPAKMSKEKSTMMRLPHWIVRRTLACLRWMLEYSVALLSMLFREKKKLQDELNQLSRSCLKDVESRSTLGIMENR